jgi:putative hydrolase of the HAD superfamily
MAETLGALRARGLKLGIITNGETEFQGRHIAALGLAALVDTVLVSQTEGLRKPDAAIFRLAADRLGVTPDQCLFVGDNPAADILGAHAAGMRTAWFSGDASWPEDIAPMPGAMIGTLSELLNFPGMHSGGER